MNFVSLKVRFAKVSSFVELKIKEHHKCTLQNNFDNPPNKLLIN